MTVPVDELAAGQVADHVGATLDVRIAGAPRRTTRGFGHANWQVPTSEGPVLVKISRPHLAPDKVASGIEAQRRARTAGVPTPPLLHADLACAALGGHPVRVQAWVAGRHRDEALDDDAAVRRFHAALGEAMAQVHSVPGQGFSSRVGQPGLVTWAEYVDLRLGQIAGRVEHNVGVPGIDHAALFARVARTAAEVSPVVRPRLVHRDLYEDNLLASDGGGLAAVLDFDLAEMWDPLADVVRLRWAVLPPYGPVAENAFWGSYFSVAGRPEAFELRVWVVEVMELANSLVNATVDGNRAFAQQLRGWLDAVVAGPSPVRGTVSV